MATNLPDPIFDIYDADGNPISGGSADFYLTGTTTPAIVYADNALTTPRTQPVPSDSAGRFPVMYLDSSVLYRMKVFDAHGVLIRDIDPLNPSQTVGVAAIADGAITTAKLADGAVTAVKIADGNISLAKLSSMAEATIIGRHAGAGTGAAEALTGAQVATLAGAATVDGVGLNANILHLTGLTTPLSLAQGGTGAATVALARAALAIPGILNFHALVTVSGTTPTTVFSSGCSVARTAQGQYTVTLAVAAGSATSWGCIAMGTGNAGNATEGISYHEDESSRTASAAKIMVMEGTNNPIDPDMFYVFGTVNS